MVGIRWFAAAAIVAIGGCSSGGSGSSAGSGGHPAGPPGPSSVRTQTFLAAEPVGIVAAAGRVWTANAAGADITGRTGPTDPPVRVAVGATPLRMTYDGRRLWVSVFGAGRVVAVDPTTGRVLRRIRVPGQPEGIVAAFGAIWVVRQQARLLTKLSPGGQVGPSYHLGAEPRLVAANDAALFASNFSDGTLTRVDPQTGTEKTSGYLCSGAQGMATTAEVVWVACTAGNEVIAVDANSLRVLGRVPVAGEPDAILFVGMHLYVVTTTGPTLVELAADPSHPSVLHRTVLGDAPQLSDRANVDATVADGTWWVSSPDENRVVVYSP